MGLNGVLERDFFIRLWQIPAFSVKIKKINRVENMEDIILVNKAIAKNDLNEIAKKRFGDMVKGVVDIEQGIMALGADLHADEEAYLLERGSKQENLWGINLYVELAFPDMLEFDSMINIRPRQNNRSRGVEDLGLRKTILEIVTKLVQ